MTQVKSVGVCAIALLTVAATANAKSDAMPPVEACSDVRWSAAFLKFFPDAAPACRDVETRNGVAYARFDGRVLSVGRDVVKVEISDVANFPISAVEFKIGSGGTVEINDHVVRVRDLKIDDKLVLWVRNGQFGTVRPSSVQEVAMFEPRASFSP